MMKANIEAGILALQGFYQVVNTKEKAILLVLLWFLLTAGGLGFRFATVEAVERLMKANCEYNHRHSIEQIREAEADLILLQKNKASIKSVEAQHD